MSQSQTDSYLKAESRPQFFLYRIAHRSRAMILLAALFLQIILEPLGQHFPLMSLILQLTIIFSAIFMVADSKRHMIIGLGCGLPASFILIFTKDQDLGSLTWLAYALILILYLHVIRLMFLRVFNTQKVTLDTITLAICIYVLLGTLWSLFYIPIAVMDSEAFLFNVTREGIPLQDNLSYFSFVTLTTLGYGDIVPVAPLARSLAILEALTGVLFMAVLISRLVGSYNSDRRIDNPDPPS